MPIDPTLLKKLSIIDDGNQIRFVIEGSEGAAGPVSYVISGGSGGNGPHKALNELGSGLNGYAIDGGDEDELEALEASVKTAFNLSTAEDAKAAAEALFGQTNTAVLGNSEIKTGAADKSFLSDLPQLSILGHAMIDYKPPVVGPEAEEGNEEANEEGNEEGNEGGNEGGNEVGNGGGNEGGNEGAINNLENEMNNENNGAENAAEEEEEDLPLGSGSDANAPPAVQDQDAQI